MAHTKGLLYFLNFQPWVVGLLVWDGDGGDAGFGEVVGGEFQGYGGVGGELVVEVGEGFGDVADDLFAVGQGDEVDVGFG